jgi:hypothetical protein
MIGSPLAPTGLPPPAHFGSEVEMPPIEEFGEAARLDGSLPLQGRNSIGRVFQGPCRARDRGGGCWRCVAPGFEESDEEAVPACDVDLSHAAHGLGLRGEHGPCTATCRWRGAGRGRRKDVTFEGADRAFDDRLDAAYRTKYGR